MPPLPLAAAAAASVCYVRLIAELAGGRGGGGGSGGALTLAAAGGGATALAANVSFGSVSGYVAFSPCDAALEVRDAASGAVLAAVAAVVPPLASGARASAFAFGSTALGTASAALFLDAAGQLPDGADNIDSAQWRVCNAIDGPGVVSIMGASAECAGCARPRIAQAAYGACSGYMRLDTTWGWNLGLADGSGLQASTTALLVPPERLLEHGAYTLVVHNAPQWSANANDLLAWTVDVEGQNAYLPIAWAALALLGLAVGYVVLTAAAVRSAAVGSDVAAVLAVAPARERGAAVDVTLMTFIGADAELAKFLANERKKEGAGAGAADDAGAVSVGGSLNESLLEAEVPKAASAAAAAAASGSKPRSKGRFTSIDTMRGLSLAIMIFVNAGGGGYDAFFDHSRWNGLTVADLVFPWFVFMSGVGMAISFAGERRRGASTLALAWKVVVRSAKLYALALFLNNGTNLSEWRVIGVLQYFSISYLIIGLVETFLHPDAGAEPGDAKASSAQALPETLAEAVAVDIGRYWMQWCVVILLVLVHLLVQFAMPVDGCPTGYLGAGGLADNGRYLGKGCTGGAHRAVDVALFGEAHMYHDRHSDGAFISSATCSEIYRCDVFDPEGALGALTAALMAFLGLQAGRVFTTYGHIARGPGGVKASVAPFVGRWATWSAVLCLAAGALCGFSKEGGVIPICKNLWSLSFVLLLAGFANALLSACYLAVDVHGIVSGAPFIFMGANSIVIYAGSEVFSNFFPFEVSLNGSFQSHTEQLASNIGGVIAWCLFARFLYLRAIFVNV